MNKTLSTTLTVLAVLALATVIFFAGSMYARANAFGPSMMFGNGWNNINAYGPNNMMNGRGSSMMGGGNGMMNSYGYNNANLPTLTLDQTKAAAEKYLASLNNSDLEIAEIMVFDNNGYVVVKETSTGIGAFELLVDPVSQIAYPEHGPNMMWNLKYSGINHTNIMREDWNLVPDVLKIAQRTMRVVKTNLLFTTVYNVIGLTLAALGFLPPVLAAAAQSLPDIGIMGNSARLLKQK